MADGVELKEPLLPYSADHQGHSQQQTRFKARNGGDAHSSDLHHEYQAGTATAPQSPPNSPPGARRTWGRRNDGEGSGAEKKGVGWGRGEEHL